MPTRAASGARPRRSRRGVIATEYLPARRAPLDAGDFYAEYFRVEDRHWWFVGQAPDRPLRPRRMPRRGLRATDRRILDLGCGTGTMLGHLRRFGEAEGVDADERAVEFCRLVARTGSALLESERLPFPDDSFDLITALDVLEHIEDDRARVARRSPGCCGRAGCLLATVPAYGWMWGAQDEISHHFRRYGAASLSGRSPEAGLDLRAADALQLDPLRADRGDPPGAEAAAGAAREVRVGLRDDPGGIAQTALLARRVLVRGALAAPPEPAVRRIDPDGAGRARPES